MIMEEDMGGHAGQCPECGKYIEDYEVDIREAGQILWPYTCKCGFKGVEVYSVEFTHHERFGE